MPCFNFGSDEFYAIITVIINFFHAAHWFFVNIIGSLYVSLLIAKCMSRILSYYLLFCSKFNKLQRAKVQNN